MHEAAGVYAREWPDLGRHVQLGYASGTVISVSFPASAPDGAEADHELLDRIVGYLAGERESFADVEVALTVPTDRRSVLVALREVPYGESVGVAALARMTPGLDPDDEDDRETVAAALANNPVPLLVPDHRVEGAPSGAPADVERALRDVEGL